MMKNPRVENDEHLINMDTKLIDLPYIINLDACTDGLLQNWSIDLLFTLNCIVPYAWYCKYTKVTKNLGIKTVVF